MAQRCGIAVGGTIIIDKICLHTEPETEFEELPEDWTCPLCAAGKEDFEATEENFSSED